MRHFLLPHTDLQVSELIYGCMRIRGSWQDDPLAEEEIAKGLRSVRAALDCGINFFDHADIYGRGRCEELFGHLWTREQVRREDVVLQSKCGIRPGLGYDFRPEHILRSVEGSLQRLRTDYLDILLLHRPDLLMDPDAVADTFYQLHREGKVRYFGVSNFSPSLQRMLQSRLSLPLVTNQIRFGPGFVHPAASWLVAGGAETGAATRGEGVLEYAMETGFRPQAYCPVTAGGIMDPVSPEDSPVTRDLKTCLGRLAAELGTTPDVLAIAWVAKHPSGIQPIIGTTRPERIQAAVGFGDVDLTHEAWYEILNAARGRPLP